MTKYLISLLAFLVFLGIIEYDYLCRVTGVWCFGAMEAPVEKAEITDPIVFNWNSDQPETTAYFNALKSRLLTSNSADSIFVITGFYTREEENNNPDFENLGFARAARIRALFPEIPDDRIRLEARRMNDPASDPSNLYAASELEWIAKPNEVAATEPSTEVRVVELPDRELIYFPYKSDNRIESETLENFLVELANQVKETGEKIVLTGHTDNVGSDDYNLDLSRRRVEDIKVLLTAKGVSEDQIKTVVMGKQEPMASNSTEEGRAKNRRVEVEHIKQ